tara:strand:+ start:299 stop:421 length:123 start_codon:yes stop_codon:yes gene_type:complete
VKQKIKNELIASAVHSEVKKIIFGTTITAIAAIIIIKHFL